jgi:hypothetical protein
MDARQHSLLNDLFNNSSGTTSTDRSVIKAGYTLELPTLSELQSVRATASGLPAGWGGVAPAMTYWTADAVGTNHILYAFADGNTYIRGNSEYQFVAVKVTENSPVVATPTYNLSAANSTVNEGSTATFTLKTTNVASGTSVDYSLSGVSTDDIVGGVASGKAVVGSNGEATIGVALKADQVTEGNETLKVWWQY